MRVFCDTNVLVAAFATRGLCADLLRLVLVEHDLVVTPVVLEELGRVLADKIGLSRDRIAAIVGFLDPYRMEVDAGAEVIEVVLRDSSDVPVVTSAIAVGAEVIVSGDRDLVAAELPIRVVTPRGFWEMHRGRE